MHIAAALRKPILCFFGDSPASYWHPWGVPYRLLQPESRNASDITVDEALASFLDLAAESGLPRAA
jgi:ADP-heptose:LPS heptosyltransferase